MYLKKNKHVLQHCVHYHRSDSVIVRVEATPVKQTDVLPHTSVCKLYEEPKYALRKCNSKMTRTAPTWFMSADTSKKAWHLTNGVIFGSSTPIKPVCKTEVPIFVS